MFEDIKNIVIYNEICAILSLGTLLLPQDLIKFYSY